MVESREVGLPKTGWRMVAWVEDVTVRWAAGRIGRVAVGDRAGEREAMGDDGAAGGEGGTRGEGGARGDGGAPSSRTGDSGLLLAGEGEGGAECSCSTGDEGIA